MTENGAAFDHRSLTDALWHGDPAAVVQAARALVDLGACAAPELLRVVREHPLGDVRGTAAVGLARLVATDAMPADEIVPALLRSLRADPSVWACHPRGHRWDRLLRGRPGLELVQLGPRAAVAVPLLGDALTDASPDVRFWAAAILAAIGPAAAPALDPLVGALQDSDWEIRNDAAITLGNIGPAAEVALATLLGQALADEQPEVRVSAALAIWRIGRRREGIPVLIEVLRLQPPPRSVIQALAEIGRVARMALPALEAAQWIAPRHADADDDAWDAVDDLSLDDELERARRQIAYGSDDLSWLRDVRGPLLEAERGWWIEHELPALRRGLWSDDEDICARAAELLDQLAPAAGATTIPELVSMAVRGMSRMPRAREVALDRLARYVDVATQSPHVGGARAGPSAALIQGAADDDSRAAIEAINVLGTLGPAAIPAIARRLRRRHSDVAVRLAAMKALATLVLSLDRGPELDWSRDGVLAYVYALLMIARQDQTAAVRTSARGALVALGWLMVDEPVEDQ